MVLSGYVRRFDDIGRIAIPKEVRKKLGIEENKPMEIAYDLEKGNIILIPYNPNLDF